MVRAYSTIDGRDVHVRTAFACRSAVRFTVEQVFLTTPRADQPPRHPEYHLVEADTVDAALARFLASSSATLVGEVQRFPGYQAVATARAEDVVFTVNLLPGSDIFHRAT
jgi:hypothetical protein